MEEKVSRIVEFMLASVRPLELLAGKVVGVGLVGLLQAVIWCVMGLLVLNFQSLFLRLVGVEGGLPFDLPEFPLSLALYFILWFLIGYFLFALLYAVVGAMSGSEQEAQYLQFPIASLLVLPLVSQVAIIQHPDSGFAVAMSMFPLFSPIVMFMRIAVLRPPATEIALSLAICFATILALVWFASKIYRIGILSYGKRPTLIELYRWLRSS